TGTTLKIAPSQSLIPIPKHQDGSDGSQLEDDRVGYVVFFPDPLDQRIRSARYTMTDFQLAYHEPESFEIPYESLGARAATKLGRADAIPRDNKAHIFRFSGRDV